MTTVIKDHEDLKAHVGKHLGYSDYLTVTQEQVQLFADATGDHQWIHLDVEKAKSGPFGQTIAHGYLTLSLAPVLMAGIWRNEGVKMGVNCQLDQKFVLEQNSFPSTTSQAARKCVWKLRSKLKVLLSLLALPN